MNNAEPTRPGNLVPNGDFLAGRPGDLPPEWELKTPRPSLAPCFKLVKKSGQRVLLAAGNGREDCIGHLSAPISLRAGRTYRMKVSLQVSPGLNPHNSLLFCVYAGGRNDGIFRFTRGRSGEVRGENRFRFPGRGRLAGDLRIYFRHSPDGRAWIRELSLEECDPVPPREVRVACVSGRADRSDWGRVLDAAGRLGTDLILLPEMINGTVHESLRGPSASLMARKAREHGMYVAGGIYYYEKGTDRLYNTALLFDRKGRRIGRYDKNHPYSPEILDDGVVSGTEVPVFKTDFGTVGMMICYDSWFTDVAELLALKGAEIILFPNAGYYRSLMPARAADNCVRVVVSSWGPCGIWDTTGTDISAPEPETTCSPNHPKTFRKVRTRKVGQTEMLTATLDLSESPSPHNWGGPFLSAPGGRRNRRDQTRLLYDEIRQEVERWWEPE